MPTTEGMLIASTIEKRAENTSPIFVQRWTISESFAAFFHLPTISFPTVIAEINVRLLNVDIIVASMPM